MKGLSQMFRLLVLASLTLNVIFLLWVLLQHVSVQSHIAVSHHKNSLVSRDKEIEGWLHAVYEPAVVQK